MGDIIPIRTIRTPGERWASGKVKCLACGHRWVAVMQTPAIDVECPECRLKRGAYESPFSAPDDYAVWTCNCGNSLMEMVVDKSGREDLMCIGCGSIKT